MKSIHFDAAMDDRTRLDRLYDGELFVYSPVAATRELCDNARGMITAAFAGRDPLHAQDDMEVTDYAAILAPLKTGFIHDPRSIRLLAKIVESYGCDPAETYIDVPRLRIATHSAYLTSGVAYAHHPHRGTWYSAPQSQINWWMPIYEFTPQSAMAFHARYWNTAVRNTSNEFDYYEWNSNGRKNASQHVKSDTRRQPMPQEPVELDPQVRLITPVGGPIMFSAAQLHSTVPNTSGKTRWSIDFRTVNKRDVEAMHGAPNADAHSTGTSLRDFVLASDLSPMPEEFARRYDDRTDVAGELVFTPA